MTQRLGHFLRRMVGEEVAAVSAVIHQVTSGGGGHEESHEEILERRTPIALARPGQGAVQWRRCAYYSQA
jgi:hypothetical protein